MRPIAKVETLKKLNIMMNFMSTENYNIDYFRHGVIVIDNGKRLHVSRQ